MTILLHGEFISLKINGRANCKASGLLKLRISNQIGGLAAEAVETCCGLVSDSGARYNSEEGENKMKKLALMVFAFCVMGSLSLAAGKSITGTVSDSHCGAKHAEAGDQAAHCVEHCAQGWASYVLVSGGHVYQLDSQDKFKGLGGKEVTVKGTLNGDNIAVKSVTPKAS
jgi:hypothetical protein